MLKSGQFATLDLLNNRLNTIFGRYVSFDSSNALLCPNMLEKPVFGSLVSDDSKDLSPASQSGNDDRDTNVA